MFLPISSNPPRITTCRVLSSSSSKYLLCGGYRPQTSALLPGACSLTTQVPSEVDLLGTYGGEVHVVEVQVVSGKALYVVRTDGLDAGGDLLCGQELRPRYDASSDAVHPRRGALEGEKRRALELLLRAVQLLLADPLLLNLMQLLCDNLHCLFDVAGCGPDVGLDRTGVRVALVVGVHRVGEPAFLPHLLEEPAAHPAAEHVVQSRHRVA